MRYINAVLFWIFFIIGALGVVTGTVSLFLAVILWYAPFVGLSFATSAIGLSALLISSYF